MQHKKESKGTIALCVQGSVAKKLVQLSATNGLWQYYYLPASLTIQLCQTLKYISMVMNKVKVTTPSSGTIYIAELGCN